MLTPNDEFWLFDWPVNPMSVPSFLVMKRLKMKPDDFLRHLEMEMHGSNRQYVKMIKVLGKYFLQESTPEEVVLWKKRRCGYIAEPTTDQEMLEIGLKLKALSGKTPEECTLTGIYFPNLNKDESAVLFSGHHCIADGIAAMQACYKPSDSIKQGVYPFWTRPTPNRFHWLLFWLTCPISMT